MKKIILSIIAVIIAISIVGVTFASPRVSARVEEGAGSGSSHSGNNDNPSNGDSSSSGGGSSSGGSSDCVNTVFFGQVCGDSDGANLINVLKIIVNVLTAVIGILAVGGIAFCGAQYLTAGDNEEKLRKAKHRMFEIIIGLAVYLLLYAILNWLLPDFKGLSV